ncbi:HD domain-containing phosphohydrolase [Meiothermus rufus]|uniref:HD domain-containing phosphohydrolase n=1 Tax=Meiothermus rufus TaxID=604332 RepID=UPI0004226602|nr:HD domain-containing phosphohydrolase [Meiothermus rufus]
MKGSRRISLIYLVFGLLWVFVSDQFVLQLSAELQATAQTLKGWVFVLLSALLIHALARREIGQGELGLQRALQLQESLSLFQKLTETAPAVIFLWREERVVFANQEALRLTGYSLEEIQSLQVWEFVHPEDREMVRARGLARLRGEEVPARYFFRILTRAKEVRWLDYSAARVEYEGKPAVLGVGLDVTESRERALSLEALAQVNLALRQSEDLKEMMENALEAALRALKSPAGSLLLYNPEAQQVEVMAAQGWVCDIPVPGPREGLTGRALQGEVVVSLNLQQDPRVNPKARPLIPPGWSGAALPLWAGTTPIGVLGLAWPPPHTPSPAEVERAALLAESIGNAIRRASLRKKLERRVETLEALRIVERAIASTLDLKAVLAVLLDQASSRLPLDALALFLFDTESQTLRLEASRGFRSAEAVLPKTVCISEESHIGRAALLRQPVHVPDLQQDPGSQADFTLREGLVAEWAYPLLAKGRSLGVLAVFTRRTWEPAPEDKTLLEALVEQAAVALDNALIYQQAVESQQELALTYERTLWAWAKAVELRDQETGGHTERVVELGLRLAQAMGLKGEALEDFRRGAILHDVGKIGIPDQILKKPGPLTPEEWAVMRLHPVYAYEWLKGIPHLAQALTIPYAHHERWDGSGYPRGLKGGEIPLPARIFAVVDVYDALTSDRPYRGAWPKEKALAYLQAEAGRSLDPQVVPIFLKLIQQDLQADQAKQPD